VEPEQPLGAKIEPTLSGNTTLVGQAAFFHLPPATCHLPPSPSTCMGRLRGSCLGMGKPGMCPAIPRFALFAAPMDSGVDGYGRLLKRERKKDPKKDPKKNRVQNM